MPGEASDLDESLENYANQFKTVAGNPPRLDIIHLGLGNDGHTAHYRRVTMCSIAIDWLISVLTLTAIGA